MISVVVPNFNSGQILKKNLPKLIDLLKKTDLDYEVIVTDDASTDDSVEILRQAQNDVKIIESDVNTGFGTNIDRGIRAARGEVVFVLNAIDILPKSANYFKLVLKHFDNPNVFSVGATKSDTINHGSGEIYFEKGFFLHRRSDGPKMLTAWADGGSQAIRREYYFKIGGFDPIYKFYWEDVDLGWRAWKAGYAVIFEQKAVLIHKKEAGPISKFYSEKDQEIMNLRNQMIFTLKNADFSNVLKYFAWEPYHIAVALKNGNTSWFIAGWQTVCQIGEILKHRWAQKKVGKVSDKDLLLDK